MSDTVPEVHGVPTAVAAFVGRARRGPVNRPVEIGSFGEFVDRFGGAWEASPLAGSVRSYFDNGGRRAYVVRVYTPAGEESRRATLSAGGLELSAADEGSWGSGLRVTVEHPDPGDGGTLDAARELGVRPADLFGLRVRDPLNGREEIHAWLTVVPSPRRVGAVLRRDSRLVRVRRAAGLGLSDCPVAGVWADAVGGSDGGPLAAEAYLEPADRPAASDPRARYVGSRVRRQGIYALDDVAGGHAGVDLVVLPPPAPGEDLPTAVWRAAAEWADAHRAVVLVDPPRAWSDLGTALAGLPAFAEAVGPRRSAALYFPRLSPAGAPQPGGAAALAPSGAVAGVLARTDAAAGVWKAPAGAGAELRGAGRPAVPLSDTEARELARLGVNAIRELPGSGTVLWGARTLAGDDRLDSEWKYLPVRRFLLFVEKSLGAGTSWAVFEPNGEPLWSRLRQSAAAFLDGLFRRGALRGATPREAYFVRCGRGETMTESDLENGIVRVEVGLAPLRPAEFVVIRIQQLAGRTPPD